MSEVKFVNLPCLDLPGLEVGDRVVFSGKVLVGRDAALPRVCSLLDAEHKEMAHIDFSGAAVLHSAVSAAGIGPTSSNKVEIEESFGPLLEAGVRVFLGKGAIDPETVALIGEYGAVFAVVPPVTALLGKGMRSSRIVAFPELGMEALYEIELEECPSVVAAVGGASIFEKAES